MWRLAYNCPLRTGSPPDPVSASKPIVSHVLSGLHCPLSATLAVPFGPPVPFCVLLRCLRWFCVHKLLFDTESPSPCGRHPQEQEQMNTHNEQAEAFSETRFQMRIGQRQRRRDERPLEQETETREIWMRLKGQKVGAGEREENEQREALAMQLKLRWQTVRAGENDYTRQQGSTQYKEGAQTELRKGTQATLHSRTKVEATSQRIHGLSHQRTLQGDRGRWGQEAEPREIRTKWRSHGRIPHVCRPHKRHSRYRIEAEVPNNKSHTDTRPVHTEPQTKARQTHPRQTESKIDDQSTQRQALGNRAPPSQRVTDTPLRLRRRTKKIIEGHKRRNDVDVEITMTNGTPEPKAKSASKRKRTRKHEKPTPPSLKQLCDQVGCDNRTQSQQSGLTTLLEE
eukprot:6204833-Pleurochrysis_carterae.AAC.2